MISIQSSVPAGAAVPDAVVNGQGNKCCHALIVVPVFSQTSFL